MNCDTTQQRMMDVLYGEDITPRDCFQFFKHLETCAECNAEYLELIGTRELLAAGEGLPSVAGSETVRSSWVESPIRPPWTRKKGWWPGLQKMAAGLLILAGFFSILQYLGLLGGPRVMVSEQQLNEMVHDMILARRVEDWEMIGEALLQLKEDVDLRHKADMGVLYQEMQSTRERFVEALEENNRNYHFLLSSR